MIHWHFEENLICSSCFFLPNTNALRKNLRKLQLFFFHSESVCVSVCDKNVQFIFLFRISLAPLIFPKAAEASNLRNRLLSYPEKYSDYNFYHQSRHFFRESLLTKSNLKNTHATITCAVVLFRFCAGQLFLGKMENFFLSHSHSQSLALP